MSPPLFCEFPEKWENKKESGWYRKFFFARFARKIHCQNSKFASLSKVISSNMRFRLNRPRWFRILNPFFLSRIVSEIQGAPPSNFDFLTYMGQLNGGCHCQFRPEFFWNTLFRLCQHRSFWIWKPFFLACTIPEIQGLPQSNLSFLSYMGKFNGGHHCHFRPDFFLNTSLRLSRHRWFRMKVVCFYDVPLLRTMGVAP